MWEATLYFVVGIGSAASSITALVMVWRLHKRFKAPSMRPLAQLSAEMLELTDSFAALLKSHETLRSRISMRENREKRADGPSTPAAAESTSNGVVSRDELRRRAGIMPGVPAKHREM